jgi:alkylation response protein AidB-like acyl-CoA dehydrogenase
VTDQIPLEDFEVEALEFLKANAAPKAEVTFQWGKGSDRLSLFPERTPDEDQRELVGARAWANRVYDAGFGWITGPPELGGRGLTREYERCWRAAASGFDTPAQTIFSVGLGMVAPTIVAHGSDTVKSRYLRAMYRGDLVGCQLFSEPGSGSDLAGVQTRAVRDGDEWIVNGQKVWTSFAHLADIGEIICRTNPEVPKHQGLTGFIVDMHAPGVEVRPLRQMTGGASFNEVFFTDVRIPDDHRLGAENGGWGVALTTLMNERAAIGGGGGGAGTAAGGRLIDLVRHMKKADDPLIRQQLATVIVNGKVASYTTLRAMAKVAAGQAPGPEMSLAKLALTQNMLRISELASSVLGAELAADSGRWGTYAWNELVLGVPGMRVAGGTDEVLRNIVGERVLGLPK